MNSRRWRTGYIYLVLGIILFGVSTFLFRQQVNMDDLPTTTEVIGQEYQGNQEVNEDLESIKDLEDLKDINTKSVEAKSIKDFQSPIQGGLIKTAGNYYSEALQAYLFHAGTDYAQTEGAVIRVKHSGKVIYAGPDPILGQKVELDCGEDWSVIYGGLENLRVKEGDQVEVNQAIGQVGYYANADGVKDQPQLHFEVWHGDEVQIPSS